MKTKTTLNCAKCGNEINIDDILITQFEDSIRKELESELNKREQELKKEQKQFKLFAQELDKKRESIDELVNGQVKALMLKKEEALKKSLKKEIEDENSEQLRQLESELDKKSKMLREFNSTKAQLEITKRELQEKEDEVTLKKEKEFTKKLEQLRTTIKDQVQQEAHLKIKEREKIIADLKLKLSDAQRSAEQGSMQLQGDVHELHIIEILKEVHPTDDVIQSKKGAAGADILQVVKTSNGATCGKIYFEAKRTKSWSNSWIPKLKEDNMNAKADILVLVTQVLPKDVKHFGIIDGVWICSYNDVKELSLVLRYGLLKLQTLAIQQNGQETKMEMLYKYLTSDQFRLVFENILQGFKKIQESHANEKLKMLRIWKEREQLLERVLANSVDFYGTVKSIAGTEIAEIPMLDPKQKD